MSSILRKILYVCTSRKNRRKYTVYNALWKVSITLKPRAKCSTIIFGLGFDQCL